MRFVHDITNYRFLGRFRHGQWVKDLAVILEGKALESLVEMLASELRDAHVRNVFLSRVHSRENEALKIESCNIEGL